LKHFTRSQLLKRLRESGYPITSRDISWAYESGIIQPRVVRDNFFKYTEQDFLWLERIGELKKKGVTQAMLTTIVEAGIDEVYMILDKMSPTPLA